MRPFASRRRRVVVISAALLSGAVAFWLFRPQAPAPPGDAPSDPPAPVAGREEPPNRPRLVADQLHGPLYAAFAADGKQLVTVGADQCVVWHVESRCELRRFACDDLTIRPSAAALSPDGRRLVGGSGLLYVTDTRTGTRSKGQLSGHKLGEWVTSAAFSADGSQFVTGARDGLALTRDPNTLEVRRRFQHPAAVSGVALTADGGRLLTGCTDGQARLWNVATGQLERQFDHG